MIKISHESSCVWWDVKDSLDRLAKWPTYIVSPGLHLQEFLRTDLPLLYFCQWLVKHFESSLYGVCLNDRLALLLFCQMCSMWPRVTRCPCTPWRSVGRRFSTWSFTTSSPGPSVASGSLLFLSLHLGVLWTARWCCMKNRYAHLFIHSKTNVYDSTATQIRSL